MATKTLPDTQACAFPGATQSAPGQGSQLERKWAR
jgi:hypothetical protein